MTVPRFDLFILLGVSVHAAACGQWGFNELSLEGLDGDIDIADSGDFDTRASDVGSPDGGGVNETTEVGPVGDAGADAPTTDAQGADVSPVADAAPVDTTFVCGLVGLPCCGAECSEGACLEGSCATWGGSYVVDTVLAEVTCSEGNPSAGGRCACPTGFARSGGELFRDEGEPLVRDLSLCAAPGSPAGLENLFGIGGAACEVSTAEDCSCDGATRESRYVCPPMATATIELIGACEGPVLGDSFGGSYAMQGAACAEANPLTGDCGCSAGFVASRVPLTCQSVFFCSRPGP